MSTIREKRECHGRNGNVEDPCDFYMNRGYTNAYLTILPLTYR